MKRKKRAIALSLSIPLLLQGRADADPGDGTEELIDAEAEAVHPAYPAYPAPAPPPSPSGGSSTSRVAPTPAPTPDEAGSSTSATSLPVTGGDLLGLAAAGGGAVATGFGLNRVTSRRRNDPEVTADVPRATVPGAAPPDPQEDPRVSTDEPQYRLAPEALESEDLLDGIEGPARERLAAVLHSAATSYRATIDELEATRSSTDAGGSTDRFAELGEHVAWVLRASHDAAEEERRKAEAEVAARVAAADAELERRRSELDAEVQNRRSALEAELAEKRDAMDQDERRAAERLRQAEEEASGLVAQARAEAEAAAASIRADAEGQLSSLLQVQEALRSQLVEASDELRRSLAALAAAAPSSIGGTPEPVAPAETSDPDTTWP